MAEFDQKKQQVATQLNIAGNAYIGMGQTGVSQYELIANPQ